MSIVIPRGVEIHGQEYRSNVGTVLLARQNARDIRCIGCEKGDKLRKKSRIKRLVRHLCVLNESAYIEWYGHKYHCLRCQRYFHERFPGVYPWRRYTEAFRKEMVNLHQKGISQTDIRVLKKVGTATIERWYHELLGMKNREYQSYEYSTHMGIDEHRFSRKVGFSTTLCDLKNNRILDVTKGRSGKEIIPALKRIPGRERVKMVNLDLSETYRAIAKEVFPNAVLVADRFHVIRLINQHFLDTWKLLDSVGRHNRGLLSLMRRHSWHLKPIQKLNLETYLNQVPGLKAIYDFKQDLAQLLLIKHCSKRQCKPLIPLLLTAIDHLQNTHFDPLVTLGNTLHNWQFEIAAMWRFTKSNSITEGFHRKMKLIQRRAYGFKNFENYRLRVRVLCSSMNFVFT